MPPLISCQSIAKAYGAAPLFRGLSFTVDDGDRVGIVGPNGSGKSTLLRILAGLETPDEGLRTARRLLRVAHVAQRPEFRAGRSIEQCLADALTAADPGSGTGTGRGAAGRPVAADETEVQTRVAILLGRLGFPEPAAEAVALSGGWQKRLAIACAMIREPDLLLLDEPTNHLDLDGVLWLEEMLTLEPTAFVVVSHDRWFLENVATRVIEVDRVYPAGLLDVRGRWHDFLERKDETLAAQAAYQETLANKVRREIDWLRRGPPARTTKSQSRIDEAGRLIDELATVKQRTARRSADLDFTGSERRTRRLIVAEGVGKSFGERPVLRDVDLVLASGTRLGLLGANGSGKTTLLRLLVGELEPDAGTLTRAADLRVVYFDQARETLDPGVTLRRALAPEGDQVVYRDRPLHVASWARRFLFRSEQLAQPVSSLSGGEQARVIIARLMLRPADVLILDEPTNDLDVPTLEALEESLLEFPGAVVLVTHDRFLFDRVTTQVIGLDGDGGAAAYGDRDQWLREQAARAAARTTASSEKRADTTEPQRAAGAAVGAAPAPAPAKRLSYKEKRELEQIEERILAAEGFVEQCRQATEDPALFADGRRVKEAFDALQTAQDAVDRLYARWAELGERG